MQTELTKALQQTEVEIQDGKLSMIDGGDSLLYLRVPRTQPLGSNEPIAKLVIAGEDFHAEAPLTHTDVTDLRSRLQVVESGEVFEDD